MIQKNKENLENFIKLSIEKKDICLESFSNIYRRNFEWISDIIKKPKIRKLLKFISISYSRQTLDCSEVSKERVTQKTKSPNRYAP